MAYESSVGWSADFAAHLLRRAGFGGTPEEADELASLGLEAAVEKMLGGQGPDLPVAPRTDPSEQARRRRLRLARRENRKIDPEEAALMKEARGVFQELCAWWLERMRIGGADAREKLTLFWHGHFATSQTKVRFNHLMLGQNETLRRLGMGPFRDLCEAMASDPAMLVWLDGRQNEAKAPNENFAREIMELFTLGEGHYSEDDIREAARCFTGWVVRMENGRAAYVSRRHDTGNKVLFGKSGNFGMEEAVDIICSQPRCAEFLAGKMWEFYAYQNPAQDLVKSLAAHYLEHGLQTGELLRMIFSHPEFYSARSRATQIKSPVQWLVQVARETGRQLLPAGIALPLAAELGQNLFMPPSVKGWDGGAAWINSATLIRRSNTALLFAVAAPPLPVEGESSMDATAWRCVAPAAMRNDAEALVQRLEKVFLAVPAAPSTLRKLNDLLAKTDFPCSDETVREASVILLGSPEYNLC